MFKKLISLSFCALFSLQASATVVEIRTVMGDIQVNLFDEDTPITVENFLDYVNSGAFANNVVHRLEGGFVMQAGGYQYNNFLPLDSVPTGSGIENEPVFSNVRGTIAMAKLSGDPNSATSQWFINLADNSANLDVQNGGFTVFGQVIGDGMDIIDAIEDLPRYNMGGVTSSIPLRNYSDSDFTNDVQPDGDNFVLITDIVVIDAATVTNPDLDPKPNTLLNNGGSGGNVDVPSSDSSSGGSVSPLALIIGLFSLLLFRRKANA